MDVSRTVLTFMLVSVLCTPVATAQWVVRQPESAQKREQLEKLQRERERLEEAEEVATRAVAPTDPAARERAREEQVRRDRELRRVEARIAALEVQPPATSSPLLPQAGLNVGKDAANVTLQAFEFFLTDEKRGASARFYLRSTLPVKTDPPADPKTTPSDALRAGILDPFGGILNAALGVYATRGSVSRVDFDARAGVKLLETPSVTNAQDLYDTNPFLTGSASLKAVLALYRDPKRTSSVGTLSLAVGGNVTSAASKDYLQSLTGVKRTTVNLTLAAVIDLPGVFYVTVDGSPWTNNRSLGKRFVVSFNAVRDKSGSL